MANAFFYHKPQTSAIAENTRGTRGWEVLGNELVDMHVAIQRMHTEKNVPPKVVEFAPQ